MAPGMIMVSQQMLQNMQAKEEQAMQAANVLKQQSAQANNALTNVCMCVSERERVRFVSGVHSRHFPPPLLRPFINHKWCIARFLFLLTDWHCEMLEREQEKAQREALQQQVQALNAQILQLAAKEQATSDSLKQVNKESFAQPQISNSITMDKLTIATARLLLFLLQVQY
jgi:hypothetical protein